VRRVSTLLAFALIGATCSVAACSRATNRYDTATLNRLRAKFQGVTLVVRQYVPRKHDKEWAEAPKYLIRSRTATVAYLQEKNIFGNVLMSMPQPATGRIVVVDAVLEDYRIVSGAARFFGGALAGSSYMTFTVRLTDGATGSPITTRRIESANNAYAATWVGGASDRSLPTDMGGIIGEFVIRTLEARP